MIINRSCIFYLLLIPIFVFPQKRDHRIRDNTEICPYRPTIFDSMSENKFKILGSYAGACSAMSIMDRIPEVAVNRMITGMDKIDKVVDRRIPTNFLRKVIKTYSRIILIFGIPMYLDYKAGSVIDDNFKVFIANNKLYVSRKDKNFK
jgi:hypothetical protein